MRVTISMFVCLLFAAAITACADSSPRLQDPSYSEVEQPMGTGGAQGFAMDSMQTGTTSMVAAGTGHGSTAATSSTGMTEGTGSTTAATGGWSE